MKLIRKISSNPIVLLFVIINFIFVSCSTSDNNILPNKNQLNNTKFSDIDVFKGVMFLEGPVADMLPSFKELNFRNYLKNESDIEKIKSFQTTLIAYINTNNPSFLSKFRKDITSGDYYKVKNILNLAVNEIKSSSILLGNLDVKQLSKIESSISTATNNKTISKEDLQSIVSTINGSNQLKANDSDVCVLVYAAVAVVCVVVAVFFWVAPNDPSDNPTLSSKKSFYSDSFQTDITLNLKGI